MSDVWRERDKTEMSLRTLDGLDKQSTPNMSIELTLERVCKVAFAWKMNSRHFWLEYFTLSINSINATSLVIVLIIIIGWRNYRIERNFSKSLEQFRAKETNEFFFMRFGTD